MSDMQSLKVSAHSQYLHSITQVVTKSLFKADSSNTQVSSGTKLHPDGEKEIPSTGFIEKDVYPCANSSDASSPNSCIPTPSLGKSLLVTSSLNTLLGGAYWTFGALSLLHADLQILDDCVEKSAEKTDATLASASPTLETASLNEKSESSSNGITKDISGYTDSNNSVKTDNLLVSVPAEFKLLEATLEDSLLSLLHCLQIYLLIPTSVDFLLNFEHRLNHIKKNVILPLQQSDSGSFRDLPTVSHSQVESDIRLNLAALQCILLIDGLLVKIQKTKLRVVGFETVQRVSSIALHKPIDNTTKSRFCRKHVEGTWKKMKLIWMGPILAPSLLLLGNSDGGFGGSPGNESHAGLTFCAISCLCLLGKLDSLKKIHRQRLIRWLSERQTLCGGMNGRPGKAADVCYSFWVTATLAILGVSLSSVIRIPSLVDYIFKCQHASGGFSRIPPLNDQDQQQFTAENSGAKQLFPTLFEQSTQQNALETEADPFHTFFALAALAILAHAVLDINGSQKNTQKTFCSHSFELSCGFNSKAAKGLTPTMQHELNNPLATEKLSYDNAEVFQRECSSEQSSLDISFPVTSPLRIASDLQLKLRKIHPIFALPICYIDDICFSIYAIL
ncbi:prenyltransferase and squalene oxidase repeat-containing protein [Cardiosporidium cionae]|uniref:Geranylgeranyl transferase type II subunit beta n=1 Tax=Cardiosporidium cionae TaxID=476202 RepID=A0ABQ7JE69_9APIC|nr:prenyltransferase and squalene oxidase repeat-containing protein [Cardiosporidium cionae]|eukprot:KAF8822302.1 prenyltransferase and squalene oxidase repeat-containing protein [Cardiosporidium cionae]